MAKKIHILLFLFFLSSITHAQDIGRYRDVLDTIIPYDTSITEYHFSFKGGRQGFYWDTIAYLKKPVLFKIKNNTGVDILIKRVGGGDGAFLFYSQLGKDHFYRFPKEGGVLRPDSFLIVRPKCYSRRCPFVKPLNISYHIDGFPRGLSIPTWGCISDPKKFSDKKAVPPREPRPNYSKLSQYPAECPFNLEEEVNYFYLDTDDPAGIEELSFIVTNNTGEMITVTHLTKSDSRLATTLERSNQKISPGTHFKVGVKLSFGTKPPDGSVYVNYIKDGKRYYSAINIFGYNRRKKRFIELYYLGEKGTLNNMVDEKTGYRIYVHTAENKNISETCRISSFEKGYEAPLLLKQDYKGAFYFELLAPSKEHFKIRMKSPEYGVVTKVINRNRFTPTQRRGRIIYLYPNKEGRYYYYGHEERPYRLKRGYYHIVGFDRHKDTSYAVTLKHLGLDFAVPELGLIYGPGYEREALAKQLKRAGIENQIADVLFFRNPELLHDTWSSATYFTDKVEIVFTKTSSAYKITRLFKKMGIANYHKLHDEDGAYIIDFSQDAGRSYKAILDDLWELEEVKYLRQFTEKYTVKDAVE